MTKRPPRPTSGRPVATPPRSCRWRQAQAVSLSSRSPSRRSGAYAGAASDARRATPAARPAGACPACAETPAACQSSSGASAVVGLQRLLPFVRLSSERASRVVRQDCSFTKKQEPSTAPRPERASAPYGRRRPHPREAAASESAHSCRHYSDSLHCGSLRIARCLANAVGPTAGTSRETELQISSCAEAIASRDSCNRGGAPDVS
jgi:hypothetical protein